MAEICRSGFMRFIMEIIYRNLAEMKPHPLNPRKNRGEESIKEFAEKIESNPKHFEARPILLSNRTGEWVIIGGERRWESALSLGWEMGPSILIEDLTIEEEERILIEDNTHTGIWDNDKLKKWDKSQLKSWGVDERIFAQAEKVNKQKATEMLSDLHYDTLYYEPEEKPSIKLSDCVDLSIFEKKIQAIEESKLNKKQKEVLKLFAYRFIRIDFENVANYYAFNASEEEQKVMERLRLVLVDNSVNGFIEDDLLKISQIAIDGVLNKNI